MTQKINCPICKSEKTKHKLDMNKYKYYKCRDCGVIFLENKYGFEDLKEIYNNNYFKDEYKPDSDFNYFIESDEKINEKVDLNRETVDKFRKYLLEDKKVLEIGCAAGYFLEAIKKEGNNNVHGLEISHEAAEFAKNKFNINIIGDNIDSVDEKYNNFFDSIVMFHVLEHLKNPSESLGEIKRFLKPGGILIIEIPNVKSFDIIASKRIKKEVFHAPYHLFAFNMKSLKDIVENQGFKVLEQDIFFSTFLLRTVVRIKDFFRKNKKDFNVSAEPSPPKSAQNGKENKNIFERVVKGIKFIIKEMIKKIFPGSNMKIICEK